MRNTPIAAALVLLAASCQSFQTVHGSGVILTEERQVSSFQSLDVAGSAHVVLTQGHAESLTIECDDNLLPHLITRVSDGILSLEFEDGSWSPSQKIVYRIGMEGVEDIRIRGSVSLETPRIEGADVAVRISGSGDLEIGSLVARSLELSTSGSSQIAIGAGEVASMNVRTSGSSDLEMPGVRVGRAEIRISGSGAAELWVEDELEARISGSGDVAYRGHPHVTSSISGSGSIHAMGGQTEAAASGSTDKSY